MSRTILRTLLALLPVLVLSACGGGGGGSGTTGTTSGTSYHITGTLSGLASGQSLTLYDKLDGDSLNVTANGSFAFAQTLGSGANYAVTISSQPTGQQCFVTDGLGVVGSGDVTTVAVSCSTPHTIGGTVTGLASGMTVTLVDNSRDALPVSGTSGAGAVSFTFVTPLSSGEAYDVQIKSQPTGTVCQVVSGGSGTVSSTIGANVTNVQVDCSAPKPEYLYVATTNGSIGITPYKINNSTGALGALGSLVTTDPYPVALAADSSGTFLYTVGGNGGANDVTPLSIASSTSPNPPPGGIAAGSPVSAGSNPYGVAVSPNGNYVYVTNNDSNSISIYSTSGGALTPIGTVASTGNNPQGIVFNPAGTFLYVLNSGSDTITTFAADPGTGALTVVGSPVPTGVTPYGVQASVTPGGTFLYVANYGSSSISAYSLGSNGLPSPITGSPFAAGNNPFAVTINPSGTFAYVANETDGTVSVYAIDATYGSLKPVGSPVPVGAGSKPASVVVDPSGLYLYVSNDLPNGSVVAFSIDQSSGVPSGGSTVASGLGEPRPMVAVRP